MTRKICAICLSALLMVLTACGSAAPPKRTATFYEYFDTVSTVIGYERDAENFDAACALVEDALRQCHRLCDIYRSYAGMNNLQTVNSCAGTEAVPVDSLLLDVLDYARIVCAETDGYCNAAMGAVLSLWHECREAALDGGEARLPDPAALKAAGRHCRMDDMVINRAAGTVYLRDADMSLDLGAIAKGWATERAARLLAEAGYSGYALSIGGNVRVVGPKPGGTPWISGIRDPNSESESAYLQKVALTDEALVTSGSYQRYYEVDGRRYHHIISPQTLYPENQFLSLSILAADSAKADALSTAVFNMTLEDGLAFICSLDGVEACWVLPDGSLRYSDGFETHLVS